MHVVWYVAQFTQFAADAPHATSWSPTAQMSPWQQPAQLVELHAGLAVTQAPPVVAVGAHCWPAAQAWQSSPLKPHSLWNSPREQ